MDGKVHGFFGSSIAVLSFDLKAEAGDRSCSMKKAFLEISQIHRKTPTPDSLFLNKVAGLSLSLQLY